MNAERAAAGGEIALLAEGYHPICDAAEFFGFGSVVLIRSWRIRASTMFLNSAFRCEEVRFSFRPEFR